MKDNTTKGFWKLTRIILLIWIAIVVTLGIRTNCFPTNEPATADLILTMILIACMIWLSASAVCILMMRLFPDDK